MVVFTHQMNISKMCIRDRRKDIRAQIQKQPGDIVHVKIQERE